MDETTTQLLARLLEQQAVLALAVMLEGRPHVGQVPFALRADYGALYVHTSRLARHSRGLSEGAPFSALIQAPGAEAVDPFRRPRVTLEGRVRELHREGPEWTEARDLYLARLPSGAVTFSLGDFDLHELVVERGRFVAGFGSAHTVTPAILAGLAPTT